MSLMYFLLLKCRLHGIHDTLGPYSDPCGTAPKGTVGAGALCVVTTVGVAARGRPASLPATGGWTPSRDMHTAPLCVL